MKEAAQSIKELDYLDIEVGFWADEYKSIDEVLDWVNEQKLKGATHLKGSGYASLDGDVESISFTAIIITSNTHK